MARKATARTPSEASGQMSITDPGEPRGAESIRQAKPRATPRTTAPAVMYRLTVRITDEMDRRISAANEQYNLGPQPIVHEALNAYADALGIPQVLPIPKPEDRPHRAAPPSEGRRSRSPRGVRKPEPPKIGTRVTPLTDTRLTALCELTGDGPQQVVNTALNIWMNRKGIRGSGAAAGQVSA